MSLVSRSVSGTYTLVVATITEASPHKTARLVKGKEIKNSGVDPREQCLLRCTQTTTHIVEAYVLWLASTEP